MSDFLHIRTVGIECAPKPEMRTTSGALTSNRLYLVPIVVTGQMVADTYFVDMNVTGNIDVTICVYEQTDKLSSTGTTANLIPLSGNTSTGITAAFQTIPIANSIDLLPGSYWIGFIFHDNTGTSTVTSANSTNCGTEFKSRYMYNDPGSFTTPTTIAGNALGYQSAVSLPIYAAMAYTGDAIP